MTRSEWAHGYEAMHPRTNAAHYSHNIYMILLQFHARITNDRYSCNITIAQQSKIITPNILALQNVNYMLTFSILHCHRFSYRIASMKFVNETIMEANVS